MNKIVCMSTSNWHPFPTRKQHVMSRMDNAEILYFDPPITYIAPLKDKSCKPRLTAWKKPGEKVKENITVYALPPVLPFYNKFRFINKINQSKIARFVKKKMRLHGFENPVLWCYSPMSGDVMGKIPHKALVYDCVDRHAAYKGMINADVVNAMEKDLASSANQVFATASGLFDTLYEYNENTVMLPNGVNFEHFNSAASGELSIPADIKDIPRPIIGFSGMLQECIDYAAIEEIAKTRPDWSVVLVGGTMPDVNLDYLKKYPNIHFLGMKKYADMPAYIASFDVCLNVFRSGELSKDVSPLKFFEYLASGKPVVSTPQPEQVLGYSDSVYIAYETSEMVKKCEEALAEVNDEKTRLRIEHGRACSWESRVREMEKILARRGVFEEQK